MKMIVLVEDGSCGECISFGGGVNWTLAMKLFEEKWVTGRLGILGGVGRVDWLRRCGAAT